MLVLAIAIPFFGAVVWWNWIRPFSQASDIREAAAGFEREIEANGGRHALVSSTTDIVDPATWGGLPFAIDGVIPIDEDFFLYIRWRQHGHIAQHSFIKPQCDLGTWTELGPTQWEAERDWFQRDFWGAPLPEAFANLTADQARSLIGEFEPSTMLEHEQSLVCGED